jgi:hypothetical protein
VRVDLWAKVAGGAAALAMMAAVINDWHTVAEAFPIPTKDQMDRAIAAKLAEFSSTINIGDIQSRLSELDWKRVYDTAGRLQFEVDSQRFQILQLRRETLAFPDDMVRAKLLSDLEDNTGKKQLELAKLECQIEHHGDHPSC